MTAEEIRDKRDKIFDKIIATCESAKSESERQAAAVTLMLSAAPVAILFLSEIAAQLAEINKAYRERSRL